MIITNARSTSPCDLGGTHSRLLGRLVSWHERTLKVLVAIFFLFSFASCSGPVGYESSGRVAKEIVTAPRPLIDTNGSRIDFGIVIASGQTLTHEFDIRNLSNKTIRLVSGTALTPCCSEISRLPEQIGPGNTSKVEAKWRVAFQAGRKQVDFLVMTDADQAPIRLSLVADLKSEWQITKIEDKPFVLKLGEPGNFAYKFRYSYSDIKEMKILGVNSTGGLVVHLADDAIKNVEAGIGTIIREFSVGVPPSDVFGMKRGTVSLILSNGKTIEHPVLWEVAPSIRVNPAVVIHDKGSQKMYSVLVSSTDDALNVTGASSRDLDLHCTFEKVDDRVTKISFSIPQDARLTKPIDVKVATGHSKQPEVLFAIVSLSK